MSTRPIRFFHQGQLVSVDTPETTRTVLQWLREDAHCTGTKEGCAEGDCGACTVVLGQLDKHGELALAPVNACIQFLPTLDGKALFTVEALATAPSPQSAQPEATAQLHPVQQAMVDCHGSQCGFCTPGFVMSLWSSYQSHLQAGSCATRQQLADDLSGNLCRCTGYRPILDAGERMFTLPAAPLAREPVVQALRALQAQTPLHCGPGFHAPQDLSELARLRLAHPAAKVLAGGTDMGLWVTKQFRQLPELLYIGEVAELKDITDINGDLHIGAAVSLEAAWRELVQRWPTLRDMWLRFASPPIRHAGTLCGNVANGSPIGDCAPVLMALNASVVLRRGERVRNMRLADFYLGYMKNQLEEGEFVQGLVVPAPEAPSQVRAYKISKRYDCDISSVSAGLAIALTGDTVDAVRLVFGGLAATVQHAARAEAAVLGQPWREATLLAATTALAHDFTPLGDMRASADYRLQVAQNLLRRFWLETRVKDPLPERAVSVWHREEMA